MVGTLLLLHGIAHVEELEYPPLDAGVGHQVVVYAGVGVPEAYLELGTEMVEVGWVGSKGVRVLGHHTSVVGEFTSGLVVQGGAEDTPLWDTHEGCGVDTVGELFGPVVGVDAFIIGHEPVCIEDYEGTLDRWVEGLLHRVGDELEFTRSFVQVLGVTDERFLDGFGSPVDYSRDEVQADGVVDAWVLVRVAFLCRGLDTDAHIGLVEASYLPEHSAVVYTAGYAGRTPCLTVRLAKDGQAGGAQDSILCVMGGVTDYVIHLGPRFVWYAIGGKVPSAPYGCVLVTACVGCCILDECGHLIFLGLYMVFMGGNVCQLAAL